MKYFRICTTGTDVLPSCINEYLVSKHFCAIADNFKNKRMKPYFYFRHYKKCLHMQTLAFHSLLC